MRMTDISTTGQEIYRGEVTKRLVDIDDDLLARARAALGTATMKDTVNGALQEVVNLELRRRHADQLATMEGLDLDDPTVMSRAWR